MTLHELDESDERLWTRPVGADANGAFVLSLDLEPGLHRLLAEASDARRGALTLQVSSHLREANFAIVLDAD